MHQVEEWLFPGIDYRHVVLTVPEQLRRYFEGSPRLLSELIKAGVETLNVVMSQAAGQKLQIGVMVVVQTAGRASNYNPHLHVMVTGGGIDEAGKWQEVKTVSYDFLHREWQRQLFAMLEAQVRESTITALLDSLRQEYDRGLGRIGNRNRSRPGRD